MSQSAGSPIAGMAPEPEIKVSGTRADGSVADLKTATIPSDEMIRSLIRDPNVPRHTLYTADLTADNAGLPGDLVLDAEGKLLKQYITYMGPTAFLINGYNAWLKRLVFAITNDTRYIIPLQGQRRAIFSHVSIIRPSYNYLGRTYPLTPLQAKSNSLTYDIKIMATMALQDIDLKTNEYKTLETAPIEIGRIPVMLGSEFCWLANKTPAERQKFGIDPNDPLGYFIVSGVEKIIIMQEQLRTQRMFLFCSTKGQLEMRMTIALPTGPELIRITPTTSVKPSDARKGNPGNELRLHLQGFEADKDIQSDLGDDNKEDNDTGDNDNKDPGNEGKKKKASKTEQKKDPNKKGIGAFMMFYLFAEVYSKEELGGIDFRDRRKILALMSQFIPKKNQRAVMLGLTETITVADTESDDPIGIFSHKLNIHKTIPSVEERKKKIREFLDLRFFPQMQNQYTPIPLPIYYRLFLYMQALLIIPAYRAKLREIDDRDSWSNKQLKTAAPMMDSLFRSVLRRHIDTVKKNLKGMALGTSGIERIVNIYRNTGTTVPNMAETFRVSFTTAEWGMKGSSKMKQNVVQTLKRESQVAMIAHLQTVDVNVDSNSKAHSMRVVQNSQYGWIDPGATTEGKKCGLTKNIGATATVTTGDDDGPIISFLFKSGIVDIKSPFPTETKPSVVLVNGKYLGATDGVKAYKTLIEKRRRQELPLMAEIVLAADGGLYISTDESLLKRPIMIVTDGQLEIDRQSARGKPFAYLLSNGIAEYLSPWEDEFIKRATRFSSITQDLEEKKAEQAYHSSLEQKLSIEPENKNYRQDYVASTLRLEQLAKRQAYTHCDMDPSILFGSSISTMPAPQHAPSARISYQGNMGKQALTQGPINQLYRFGDGTIKGLVYATRPIFDTQMNSLLGLNDIPQGITVRAAALTGSGWTQEDAFVLRRSSVERGMFYMWKDFELAAVIESRGGDIIQLLEKPVLREGESPEHYQYMSREGLPTKHAYYKEKDAVIGVVEYNTKTKERRNISVRIPSGEEGYVYKVMVHKTDGSITVKVKLRIARFPIKGDKFASRYAQKGTVGIILDDEDFPFEEASGLKPDLLFNSHAIPSRMTINMILEILLSKAAVLKGERINATAFRSFDIDAFQQTLFDYGYSTSGSVSMIDGATGRRIPGLIFTGPIYYQALRHHVKDKIQYRGRGPSNIMTAQPVSGRSRNGGIRFGEMERDTGISHGGAAFIKDRLCTSSDQVRKVYCINCGTIAALTISASGYVCRRCKETASFGIMDIPQVMNVLQNILAGTNTFLRFGVNTRENHRKALEARAVEAQRQHDLSADNYIAEEYEQPEEEEEVEGGDGDL